MAGFGLTPLDEGGLLVPLLMAALADLAEEQGHSTVELFAPRVRFGVWVTVTLTRAWTGSLKW